MTSQIPGASLVSMHMLKDKLTLAILNPSELTVLSPASGLQVTPPPDQQDFTTMFVSPGAADDRASREINELHGTVVGNNCVTLVRAYPCTPGGLAERELFAIDALPRHGII
jgi:hypothetical protein